MNISSLRRRPARHHAPLEPRPPRRLRQHLNPVAAALLAALPLAAQAQTAALDPVVIEGLRPAAEASAMRPATLDTEALRRARTASSDSAALLRDIPGVALQGAGGLSSLPIVHGLSGDRLRIKIDGMDLIASCPNHMNPPLSSLDPAAIGALEVYAGITPVSVGGDSIGGTVVARTRDPVFATDAQGKVSNGEIGAYWRSNGNAQGVNASASMATPTLYVAYSGAMARSDNLRAGADFKSLQETGRPGHLLPGDEIGSTAYDTRNHSLSLAHRQGNHLFEARLGLQDLPLQLYPNQRMDMLDNRQQRVNLRYLGRFDGGTVEARLYHEGVEHRMDFGPDRRFWYGSQSGTGSACDPIRFAGDPAGTCAAGMPMTTESRNLGLTVKADLQLHKDALLRIGAEAQTYRLQDLWPASGGGMGPDVFQNIHDGERDRTALFAEWQATHSRGWTTSVGLRAERVRTAAGEVQGYSTATNAPGNQLIDAARFNAGDRSRSDINLDVTLLARRTISRDLDLEFGVARKLRSPNLYERYTWSTWAMAATMNNFVGDGNGYVGLASLKPERAHTLSATLDWHGADGRWGMKVTPYLTQVADYIDAMARPGWVAGKFNVLSYANQSARIVGADLSGHLALHATRWGSWRVDALLNLTHGENRDSGAALFNIMPLNGKLSLSNQHGDWRHGVELVAVANKTRVSTVRNEVPSPGYGLVNLRTGYAWKRLRLDLGVDNLFDKSYVLPTGGAYVGQGTTMSINGVPWGVGVPGPGRSFSVAATLLF